MSEISNSGLAWLATTIPISFVCMIVISCRIVCQNGGLKKTDVGVLIALGFAIAQEIEGCVGILIWGLAIGNNDAALFGHEKAQKATMSLYITQILYQTTLAITKISLILFYLDFLLTSNLRLRLRLRLRLKLIYNITNLSILLSTFAFDTATIFQCTPISFFWYPTIDSGHCLNIFALEITHAVTDIFFYLLLFILSLPILRSLPLISTGQKYAIACAYFLGCIVLATSILNLTYLIPRARQSQLQPPILSLFTHSLESLLSLLLLSLLTLHTPISHLFTSLTSLISSLSLSLSCSLPSLPPLPTLPPFPFPFPRPRPFPFTRTRNPTPQLTSTSTSTSKTTSLTRFPRTSPWKTLKSLKSTSSFRSFPSRSSKYSPSRISNLTSLGYNQSIEDEMMVYVTVLGDLQPTLPAENRIRMGG